VCVYVFMYVRTYVCMYVCMYVRACVRMYVCAYVYMYVCDHYFVLQTVLKNLTKI